LQPKEFLEYTPAELSAILFYHDKNEDERMKIEWERTRIQTYFLISIQLTKKNKISYTKFRKDIWPFIWEENKEINENPEEGLMNIDQWNNLFNKPVISAKEIGLNEDLKI